jgi:hypothetical protein
MSYSIPGIPTIYRGRRYRSRLEARWAAFFDRLGLAHEYEPFDLGRWSPDFMLPSSCVGFVLVEVKPVIAFDPIVGLKMAGAMCERGLAGEAALLVGVRPEPVMESGRVVVQLGWLGCRDESGAWDWSAAIAGWPASAAGARSPDILRYGIDCADERGWSGSLTYRPAAPEADAAPWTEHAMEMWAGAGNDIQWQGQRA